MLQDCLIGKHQSGLQTVFGLCLEFLPVNIEVCCTY